MGLTATGLIKLCCYSLGDQGGRGALCGSTHVCLYAGKECYAAASCERLLVVTASSAFVPMDNGIQFCCTALVVLLGS